MAYSSRVLHPNVVQVLGIHYPTPEAKPWAKLPWLVMEMMECSLAGFLKNWECKKDKVYHFISSYPSWLIFLKDWSSFMVRILSTETSLPIIFF